MGLDGVALVLDWEERFGIEIPDADAASILTPKQAIDYIFAALPKSSVGSCLTQQAFYRARTPLLALSGIGRREISPRRRLEDLIPQRDRRATWKELSRASGLARWPMLRRPSIVIGFAWLTSLLLGVSAFALSQGSLWLVLAVTAGSLMATFIATIPLATEFSRHIPTMGGLARYLALHNAADLVPAHAGWTRRQVRDIVRDSVVDQLGVSPDFDENAEFVRDLGVS